jgi:leucyl aminopeptidase
MDIITAAASDDALPLHVVPAEELDAFLDARAAPQAAYARAAGFRAKPGELLILPDTDGAAARALVGAGDAKDPFVLGAAPLKLPERAYGLASAPEGWSKEAMALAWALGSYRFTRYKAAERGPARLTVGEGVDLDEVARLARAVTLVRDLVNTPAGDMGPVALEAAARELAGENGATCKVVTGEKLLKENFPVVHAVGRAAGEAPRLIEIEWGEKDAPRLAVVGKGVCFDTGGLNLKPGDSMRLMKKDMGGAAHALGLASLVMDAKLPVRLHVVIPAVENAVGANAFRPGDILTSRAGLTVEVENTDAEGRLVLADALARAVEEKPELVLDYATLTGAARVALGPEIPPFYANDDGLAEALEAGAKTARDPIWRMPLWPGYDAQLDSPIANLKNLGAGPFGGSILAALFLQRFVAGLPWIHFDVYAWNPSDKPGRPQGGEAQGLRAAWAMLKTRYAG